MPDILPVFSTHYGFTFSSILTLEEYGKTSSGNPSSICDIAKNNNLKQVTIVDDRIDGFIEGYKNLSKIDCQMIFGVKLLICADIENKSEESLKTESSVIIFIKNTQGYSDLIKIYNRAWTENFYNRGRTSWKQLKELWTDNLVLALPFFSSFIAKNLLSFNNIVPDFPMKPIFFKEVDSGLPFASIIEDGINKFENGESTNVQLTKSIYYGGPEDFEAYTTFRARGNHSEFQRPNVDHMCSNKFSFKAWQELTK